MKLAKKLFILLIVIILVYSLVKILKIENIFLEKMYPLEHQEYVEQYAKEFGVDPFYIYSIIKAESNYDKNANSVKGAQGLMQLLPTTATEIAESLDMELTEEEIYNPEINIMLGTKYFANLVKSYGNIMLALAAYNAGPGNVTKWISEGDIKEDGSDIENIPYKETNMYVRKIVQNYRIYNELYN